MLIGKTHFFSISISRIVCFLFLAESAAHAITTTFFFFPHTKNRTHYLNRCHIFNTNLICGAWNVACDPHRERAQREPGVSLKIIRKKRFLLRTAWLSLVIHREETSRLRATLLHTGRVFVDCFCVIVVFVVVVVVRVMLSRL